MKVVVVGPNQKDRETVAKVIKDKYEGLTEMNEGLRDNKRYLENDLALKMEQISDLKKRLAFIFDVWGRWKDFERTSYPTIEQTHHALYDFGKAIENAMKGYNPE